MFGTVYLAHRFLHIRPLLLNVLSTLKSVQQVVAECFIKVKGNAGDDLAEEGSSTSKCVSSTIITRKKWDPGGGGGTYGVRS